MSQQKITRKRAELLLNNVRQIVRHGVKANLDLCQILHETFVSVLQEGEQWKFVWEVWGFKSWFDFVEIEIGMHENTANAYKKVWQVFGIDLEGAWSPDDALPITKMKILSASDKLNKQNIKSWLKKAKAMTCCDLQHEIYGEDVNRTFSVTVSQAGFRAISKALKTAREQFGDDKTNGELLVKLLAPYQPNALKIAG